MDIPIELNVPQAQNTALSASDRVPQGCERSLGGHFPQSAGSDASENWRPLATVHRQLGHQEMKPRNVHSCACSNHLALLHPVADPDPGGCTGS